MSVTGTDRARPGRSTVALFQPDSFLCSIPVLAYASGRQDPTTQVPLLFLCKKRSWKQLHRHDAIRAARYLFWPVRLDVREFFMEAIAVFSPKVQILWAIRQSAIFSRFLLAIIVTLY